MGKNKRKMSWLYLIFSVGILLIAFPFGSVCMSAQETVKLKVISAWNNQQPYTQEFLMPLVDKLNRRAPGRLQVSWFGPEAVPQFDQMKPFREGVFDILYTSSGFYMGDVGLGTAMDLFKGTPKDRRAAGFIPVLDEAYKKVNAKVLGLNVLGTGYHFVLRKELKKADFTGLKLRASPSYDPLIKALGGVPIRITPAETYSALDKGIVDGAAWTVVGVLDTKLYEAAKFLLRPQFGETVEYFLVNLDSWNKVPKDLQDIVSQVVMEAEEEGYKSMQARFQKEEAELLRLGMKISQLPPEEAEKLKRINYDRSWEEIALKFDPTLGPKLKQIADDFIKKHPQ